MDDIDELIEQLEDYVKRHSKVIDQNYVGVQLAKKAITALQKMQKENKRLDAALAEMECLAESTPLARLGAFTEHIRKAREGEISTSPS